MKKLSFASLFVFLMTMLTSCEAIKGIFKAGFFAGIIVVIVVVGLIIFVISRLFGK